MQKKLTMVLAMLLAVAMIFSMAACGNSASEPAGTTADTSADTAAPAETEAAAEPEEEEREPFVVAHEDEEIYENVLGEFLEYFYEAEEFSSLSEKYAKLAVSEAKLLESGAGAPMYANPAAYYLYRLVYHTSGYAPWRGTMNDLCSYLITNEIIKAEDYAALREIYNNDEGTGMYVADAKAYLEDAGYTFNTTYRDTFAGAPTTWDVAAATTMYEGNVIRPTYDWLIVYDAEGSFSPRLAESFEISDDFTTVTFNIREGMYWVDSQGREIAPIVASDWVAMAQHLADSDSARTYVNYIAGMAEYANGETTNFDTVGVKALDDYTLEYTLLDPASASYFLGMVANNADFLPLCSSYYQSQGGVFGKDAFIEASASPSYTYGVDQNHIAYCGPFLCTNMTDKNSVTYTANEAYWNYGNTAVTEIEFVYDDGTDATRAYDDFKNGKLVLLYLNAANLEVAKNNGDFELYASASDPAKTTFGMFFNMNRQTYANVSNGAAVSNKDDAQKEAAYAALQNQYFRLAISASIDRALYMEQSQGTAMKYLSIRNAWTPGTYVKLDEAVTVDINGSAVSFPAGTWYGAIVQAQLDADNFPVTVWDAEKNTNDGWDGWYNPEQAQAWLQLAIEDLAEIGIVVDADHPIVIDYPFCDYLETTQNQTYVLKQCIENALGGLVVFDAIPCPDQDAWSGVWNKTNDGSEVNYDLWILGNVGSDHADPICYTESFLPYDSYCIERFGMW